MKKILLLFFVILSATLLFVSCKDDKKTEYYTVRFDSNGSVAYQSRAIESGELIPKPEDPTRVGYNFLGWFMGSEKWDFETDTVNSNITLKAEWERVIHTVRFDANGGSEVGDQTVASGDFANEPPTPTRKNHKFLGWFYNNKPWNFDTDRVRDIITLVAEWEPYPTYTVTFDTKGGTSVDTQYIILGNHLSTPKTTTKANAKFIGWFYNGSLWDFAENTISADITLEARWEPIITYTVKFDSNGGTPVETQYISQGARANEVQPATPNGRPGLFLGWYYGNTKWDFNTVVTQNMTLTARWEWLVCVTFKVQYPDEEASAVTSVYIEENTTISSIIIPEVENKDRYIFNGWMLDNKPFDFNTKVTSDLTLTVKWKLRHKVTFAVQYPDEESPSDTSFFIDEGSTVLSSMIPTVANGDRYIFNGWLLDNKVFDFNTKVTSDLTLTVKWKLRYKVTFAVKYPEDKEPVKTEVYIDENTAIPSSAVPVVQNRDDCVFKRWITSNGADFDFNTRITSDMTLEAFINPLYTVTFTFDGVVGTQNDTLINAWQPIKVEKGHLIPMPKLPDGVSNLEIRGCTVGEREWNFETDRVYSDIEMRIIVWAGLPPVSPKPAPDTSQGLVTPIYPF